MLHVLIHNILPVFAVLALGFAAGRGGFASQDEARALNRIAFMVFGPALIFLLLTELDLSGVRWRAILIYFVAQVIVFISSFLVARYVFGRGLLESWLLGMAMIFVNTLLYVWPISELIYGKAGAIPVSAVVALDTAIAFPFFIITMELLAGDRAKGQPLRRIATNPVLVTVVVALALNAIGAPIPEPIRTAAKFAGGGAAPGTLFALGIVLSSHSVRPTPIVVTFSAIKLAALPALVISGFVLLSPGNAWTEQFVLSSAGPSGAMAFSLALLYKVRTETIAPVIIWTSVLSLASLAYLS